MRIFILFSLLFYIPVSAKQKRGFHLDKNLKTGYLSLLDQAVAFHQALKNSDRQALDREIKKTREIIARLHSQILLVPNFHQRIHSHRLLRSIEESLRSIHFNSSLDLQAEKKSIKGLFNSFFELAEVYDLKKETSSKMFYCNMDKSLWFQKSGKAENPINPNHRNCGQIIL